MGASSQIIQLGPLLGAVLLVAGCASPPPPTSVPVPDPGAVAWSLFLVGDVGEPHLPDDPTLGALTTDARRAQGRGTIVYLGDNVYPSGLRDSAHPERAHDEAVLRALMAVGRDAGVETVFLPGNHDWEWNGANGVAGVRRMGRFVESEGAASVVMLPDDGCPGPVVHGAGGVLRLVVLDTEWWLQGPDRGAPGPDECTPGTPEAVEAAFRAVLAEDGPPVVVVSHHPLRSGGKHGGHFTWRQHLFPLVDAASWAWLPLPIIGSAYPISRQMGISNQDVSGGEYEALIAAMERAMTGVEPLAWAAGHDHSLQVLDGKPLTLVSGTGSTDHVEPVATLESTRYAASKSGWIRLDALRDGRVRVAVVLAEDGAPREAWSAWVTPGASVPAR